MSTRTTIMTCMVSDNPQCAIQCTNMCMCAGEAPQRSVQPSQPSSPLKMPPISREKLWLWLEDSTAASEDASYITGETLVVAGGLSSRLWRCLLHHGRNSGCGWGTQQPPLKMSPTSREKLWLWLGDSTAAYEDASYITGETLVVAGGLNSRLWRCLLHHGETLVVAGGLNTFH